MLWRSFLGFCWTDECFYISTCDRFFRGATPLVDEWFRTQMSSVIMLPVYAPYIWITGSSEGVVLYFRLLYLLFSAGVATVFFRILKKEYPDAVALIPALFIMCYAHLNNATFSYYMMSELFLALSLILIYDYKASRSRAYLVISGASLALSVQSMPLFVVGFVAVMLALFFVMAVARYAKLPDTVRQKITELELPVIIKYTGIGIACVLAVFIAYMASRAGLSGLKEALPYALVDNEHTNTWGYYIRKPHRCLTDVFGVNVTYAAYALVGISFVFQRYLKRQYFRQITIAADVLLFIVMAYRSFGHTGYIQVVFFIFMLPVFFTSDRKNNRLFWLFVIPAGLVSVIYCFASSDFLYVMAIGCAIGATPGVCALYDHAKDGKITGRVLMAVCIFTLCVTFFLRLTNVYRDAPVGRLTRRITEGVAKGLYTTDEHLEQYTDVWDMIKEYCTKDADYEKISGNPKGNIMFSVILPWGYMASYPDCAFPTTWRTTAYDDEQLEKYYAVNPSSLPDVIIVLDEQYGSYDAAGDTEDDHTPNRGELSGYWKDHIARFGLAEENIKCGKIYRRKEVR